MNGTEDRFLTATTWGKSFLDSVNKEIYLIKNLKDNYWISDDNGHALLHTDSCDHEWFTDCIDIIDKGAKAEDPAMLYLAAEIKSYSDPYTSDFACKIATEKDLIFSILTAPQLYLRSAALGFPNALLWCSYCQAEGIFGFEKSLEKSKEFLHTFKEKYNTIAITLSELQFLKEEVKIIEKMKLEAARDENLIAGSCDFNYERCLDDLPNPGEGALEERLDELLDFCIGLGMPYEFGVKWSPGYDVDSRRIRDIKNDWLKWCVSQSLNIEGGCDGSY